MAAHIVPSVEEFELAVTRNGYPRPSRRQYEYFGRFLCIGNITSKREAAMILAQMIHESAGLTEKEERDCNHNYVGDWEEDREARRLFPNRCFHGRGYLQLTYGANYRAIGACLGMGEELARNPDIVLEEEMAWKTAFAFWAMQVHPRPAVQAGQFGASTKAINGTVEGAGLGDPRARRRWEIYKNVHRAFNLKAGDCRC